MKKMFQDQQSRKKHCITAVNQPSFQKSLEWFFIYPGLLINNFWVTRHLWHGPFNKCWCPTKAVVSKTSSIGYFLVTIRCDRTKILINVFLLMNVLSNSSMYAANLNPFISNSLLFRTQNHFPWICSSVTYYLLFRTPTISYYYSFHLGVWNCWVQLCRYTCSSLYDINKK